MNVKSRRRLACAYYKIESLTLCAYTQLAKSSTVVPNTTISTI